MRCPVTRPRPKRAITDQTQQLPHALRCSRNGLPGLIFLQNFVCLPRLENTVWLRAALVSLYENLKLDFRVGRESAAMSRTHYIGKAGHLAVMGELALRGYNVAMPEIDKGDDIFVVQDNSGAMWRLQIKTSLGSAQRTSTRYQFKIRETSIQNPQTPELHFVFTMRHNARWRFLVMDRAVLRNYVSSQNLGSLYKDHRQIVITLHHNDTATCSKQDLTNHLGDWNTWPEI